jgi:hypothetical protein
VPRKVFVAGEILTAADVNTNLMDQAVMSFAGTAARGSAIPSPVEGMVSYLSDVDRLQVYTTAWEDVKTGFTASETITATNASWPVPTLRSPIVKVTVIGGGGGGGGAGSAANGAAGGTTTFNAGGAGTLTATGGPGGSGGDKNRTGLTGGAGFIAMNNGGNGGDSIDDGDPGQGGQITIAYLDLTGISTVNVTIGAGGTQGGTLGGGSSGGPGGRGEVIVEYVAG